MQINIAQTLLPHKPIEFLKNIIKIKFQQNNSRGTIDKNKIFKKYYSIIIHDLG